MKNCAGSTVFNIFYGILPLALGSKNGLVNSLKLNKIFFEFFPKLLGWINLLATFNSKWEKVGESGRK